jgi:protein-disulfide isomerase
LRYADELGLDMARFTAELDDEVYRQRVLEHLESGQRSGVRGTPGFFLNGRVVDVSFGLHHLLEAVEKALHRR